jgi:hypothetical protein
MTDVALKGAYLQSVRGLNIVDGGGVTWSFDSSTNTLTVSAISGTGIANDSVSNANLANMAQGTIKGRAAAAGTGDPTDLTAAQVKTVLALIAADLSDFNEAAQDAVLGASVDSTSIDITYTDASNNWTATVIPGGVNHNLLLNYVADQHVAHTGVTLTAGAGLTGGGDISANRAFAVGAGTGITVNADDVAINFGVSATWTASHGWVDNAQIKLGTGNDLKLYHDGTNSWIENSTGILNFFATGAIRFTAFGAADLTFDTNNVARVVVTSDGGLGLADGISAPATKTGYALLYVDVADGDLKIKFSDGTVKTIVVDT